MLLSYTCEVNKEERSQTSRKPSRGGHQADTTFVWGHQPRIQKSVGHLQRHGCPAASSPLYTSTNSRGVDDLWNSKEEERLSNTCTVWESYPTSEDNLLGFHAFTGDTTSVFSGHDQRSYWKTFQNHPHLGRDGDLAPIEQFVCHLYGTPEQPTVDNARLQLFRKANLVLEMLPPTRDALGLHTARTNYQAKIWLQTDHDHIHIPSPTDISTWTIESDCLKAVWTRLPAIQDACLELVTCGCKAKYRMARCSRFKTNLNCTYACGCDGVIVATQLANRLGCWWMRHVIPHHSALE